VTGVASADFRLAECLIVEYRALFLQPALSLNLRDDLGSQHLSANSQPFRWRRLGLKTGEECLQFWSLSRRLIHWSIKGFSGYSK
jgi:hypothetical protein